MVTRKALCPRHEKNHIITVKTIIYAKNKLLIIINTLFDEVRQAKYLRIFFCCIRHIIIFVSYLFGKSKKTSTFYLFDRTKIETQFFFCIPEWAGLDSVSVRLTTTLNLGIHYLCCSFKRMGILVRVMVPQPTQLSYFLLLSWLKVF